jgi:serine-type D-Ala-D-Ala carboxypeptidase (penicillin-binding protein 5/6)
LLVDASDDTVLADRQPDTELAMASTTKLMTAYLTLRALDLDDVVTAAPYTPGTAESLMGLRPGERVSVHDLLYGLLLASGNDAAETLAVAVSGSEGAFVARMNRTAKRLGLDETSYRDPIGFDAPGHHSSAHDLIELTEDLRRDAVFRKIVDTPSIELTEGRKPRRVVNRNNLVRSVPWADGVKTGYTDDAGYVLVASGRRKGISLISAVMGAPSEAERDAASLELLRYGFSLYHKENVVERGDRLAETTVQYRDETVPLAATRAVGLTLRRDQDVEVDAKAVPAEIEGPIERGAPLGRAIVTVDGERVARLRLESTRSLDAASLIDRIDAALPGNRAGAWGLLALSALTIVLFLVMIVMWRRQRRTAR